MSTKINFQSHYEQIEQLINESSANYRKHVSSDAKIRTCIPKVILSEKNMEIYPFSHRYISEMLTEERIKQFFFSIDITPIFIDAQTGSGKTYFIFHILYAVTHNIGKIILYLANRSALKTKAKYEAIAAAAPQMGENLSKKGIEREHSFGDIDIYTYQDFYGEQCSNNHYYETNREKVKWNLIHNIYAAVVFDECHFFIADADFNCFTEKIFDFLTDITLKSSVLRIYMTGTPYNIFSQIFKKECTRKTLVPYFTGTMPYVMKVYHFDRDYTYFRPYFFQSDEEIIDKINASDEKWLIFVSSKQKADDIIKNLNNKEVFFLDSEALHSEEETISATHNQHIESLIEYENMCCLAH